MSASVIMEIPLIPSPQDFAVTLSGISYSMGVRWNDPGQYWTLDIADSSDTPIAVGIPMIVGNNLLAQLEYLNIGNGGGLYVLNDADFFENPGFDSWGSTCHLYFVSAGTVAA